MKGSPALPEKYLKKGAKVYVEGKIKSRKWQDQSGQDRYTTEVVLGPSDAKLVMLGDANRESSRADPPSQPASSFGASAPAPSRAPLRDELNDEIPF